MNKKFLTALLLGAFTIASTSTLVSCKDYDDDIDALQEQINQNDKDIANLQAALTKAETDLKAEIASLRNDLTEEQARAKAAEQTLTTNLNDEIARAKAAEGKLTTDLNDAVARIANLETRLDLAENTLKEVQATLAKKVDQSVFDEAIADINASLKNLGDDLADAQRELQKAIDDEKARALAAEAVLQGNIDDEEAARIAAVKAEEDARIAAIDAEKTAREAAVKELQLKDETLEAFDKAIDERVKAIEDDYLTSADKKELRDAIDEEVKTRKEDIAAVRSELATAIAKLDSELRALVADEKAALEDKITKLDTRLTKAIEDEASARDAADKKEAQERIAAINDLKGQLDAAVITLQNQINNLSKKVDEEVARLDGAIAQEIADREAAIAQEVIDRNQAIKDAKDEITAAYTIAIKNAIDQEVIDRNKAIKDAKDEITAAYTAAIAEAKAELQGEIDALDEKIEKINTNLINLFWQSLRALVFEPAAYYHGIEAIEVSTLNFKGLTGLLEAKVNDDQAGDVATEGDAVVVAPEIVATYHLNPSTANVSKDVEQYEFLPLDRKFYKALASDQLPITSVAPEAGKLTVKAKVLDASLIKNIAADEEVTVVALQYTDAVKDTTITSDYAALRASFITNFRVNKAFNPVYTTDGTGLDETTPYAAVAGHNHLYTTAADAIAAAATFTIPYNNAAGIDLTELVNTHVAYQDGSSDVAIDAKAADGTLETQKGISYIFELIGYHVGGKSESAWAAINEDGKTFRPQIVDGDGKQLAYGAAQAKTEIGHQPLVRVTLKEETSGKIVAVGYMKIRITTANPNLTEHFTNTKVYTLDCGDDAVLVYNLASTTTDPQEALTAAVIATIADTVNQELNITKDEFVAGYTLEMKDATTAKQFDPSGAVAVELTEYNGAVTVETDGSLTWTVKNNRAYQYFKQDSKPTTMTTYVRYKANDLTDPKTPLEYIYVQFIWTPSEINITPTAEFSKSSDARIAEYWYEKNSGEAGSGFDDIHGNVEVVGTGTCQFVFDVKNTLVGNIVQLAKDEKYTAINENMKVHFEFVTPDISTEVPGASGKKYKLLVSTTDPSQLQAQIDTEDPLTVATIIKTDIVVPANPTDLAGVITFADNAYAKDLLNYADHNLLGDRETLTAKVGVKVTTCDPIGKTIVVNDGTFNVKFLRPISITDGQAKFTDAMTGGDIQPVSLTFTDWRHTSTEEAAKNYEFNFRETLEGENYWKYYDVSKIEADIEGITTTLNGGTLGETNLSGITNRLAFVYVKPGQTLAERTAVPEVVPTETDIKTAIQDNKDYGQLYYKNNGVTVGGFKIRVPIVVTYKWGTIKSYVDCEIGNTIGNVKKK